MNVLLKLKHWQLFLLMVIPPLIGSAMMSYQSAVIMNQSMVDPNNVMMFDFEALLRTSVWGFVCNAFSLSVSFLWMWAVSINLNRKLPEELRDSPIRFAVVSFVMIFYWLFVSFSVYYLSSDIINGTLTMIETSSQDVFSEELLQKCKIFIAIGTGLFLYICLLCFIWLTEQERL